MYSNNKLAKSVRLALMFGAAATAGLSANATAAEEESAEEEVERIEVTGSRIKRTDMEGALPVTVIDRATIDLSGESSVADLLRNTTFNTSGSIRPQSGSSAQGVSSIDLRGIGADRTLVLMDGRRLPKSPSTGGTQDLSTIPMAAVERIEILTDGASAAYGSDAIGGVVNIITRNDFNGIEMKIGAAEIEHEGGDREEGSIVFGTSSDTTKVIGGVSWNSRDIIFARDFPWYSPGASVYGNSFTTLSEVDGVKFDNFNWTSLPGACNDGAGFYEVPNANALPNSAGEQKRCAYDFALVSADEASTSNESMFVNATHSINDEWEVFANASVSKSSSFGRYAPVPDSSYFSTVLPADSPNNPTNPASAMYDPAFGANQEVNWWHRFDALGNRDSEVDTEVLDLVTGASGEIFDNVFVDFGVRRTKSKTYDIGRNYLVRSNADAFIADGTYDLQNPSANPENVLNAMKATISRISEFNQDEVFASVSFDIFELPAGTVQGVVGWEWRDEYYSDQYDSLSEAGQIGGSAGNSAGGGRQARAFYFETLIPVTDSIEVTAAGRQDDYSDYGSDFSPKLAVNWNIMEDMSVRASWGEGFRAPGLDILTQKTSFAADSIVDPQTCDAFGDCPVQVNAYRIANPDLESEQSEQIALGFVWQPLDFFNFTLDYYSIEITDRIAFFSSQNLIDRELAGDPIPAGLGVTRNPSNGAITRIDTGYGNEGDLETNGIDFNGQFNFEILGGDFRSNLQVSMVNEYTIDGGRDLAGDPGLPEMRAGLSNSYTIGDFEFAYNISYIDSVAEEVVDGKQQGHIPSWTTHDVQVTYNTFWNGKITVGMQNVGGKEPPLYDYDGRDYNFNLYNGYGEITYARYTQSF